MKEEQPKYVVTFKMPMHRGVPNSPMMSHAIAIRGAKTKKEAKKIIQEPGWQKWFEHNQCINIKIEKAKLEKPVKLGPEIRSFRHYILYYQDVVNVPVCTHLSAISDQKAKEEALEIIKKNIKAGCKNFKVVHETTFVREL